MQKRKGISLIVLVITIIVMVILAGVIILTINNDDTISDASNAVSLTNKNQVQQLAELKWAHAYNTGARTEQDLKTAVIDGLTKEKIDISSYKIIVTTAGVTVKLLNEVWIQKGLTVVRGEQVLEIGDIVNYDETAGGTKAGLTGAAWKVLGADENGDLLVISIGNVRYSHSFGENSTTDAGLAKSQNDWLNGAAELDSICEPYGYGKGVIGKARSVTVEDINKVTGYAPSTTESVVTYSYNGTATPDYESAAGEGTLTFEHGKGFYYYNGEEFVHITNLRTGTIGNAFAKLTDNYYGYSPRIDPENESKAYQMLFDTEPYWLASPFVWTNSNCAYFGMRYVGWWNVDRWDLWYSYGDGIQGSWGVRAVVTLSSDIIFIGSSEEGWSY